MYKCLHCGNEFEDIDRRHYDCGTGVWEEYCPNCGSEDFEEADKCEICGEIFPESETENGVCKECLERASNDTETLMRYALHVNAFTGEELDEILRIGTFKKEAKRIALDDTYEFTEFLKERNAE